MSTISQSPATSKKIVRMMKLLSHPHRIAIVEFLCQEGPKSVREIIEELDISQSATSQHLRSLEGQDILRCYREDGKVMYESHAPGLPKLLGCLGQCTAC